MNTRKLTIQARNLYKEFLNNGLNDEEILDVLEDGETLESGGITDQDIIEELHVCLKSSCTDEA